jgi:hypothetical protein
MVDDGDVISSHVSTRLFDAVRSFDPNYRFGRFAPVFGLSFSIPAVSHSSIVTSFRFIAYELSFHCV